MSPGISSALASNEASHQARRSAIDGISENVKINGASCPYDGARRAGRYYSFVAHLRRALPHRHRRREIIIPRRAPNRGDVKTMPNGRLYKRPARAHR